MEGKLPWQKTFMEEYNSERYDSSVKLMKTFLKSRNNQFSGLPGRAFCIKGEAFLLQKQRFLRGLYFSGDNKWDGPDDSAVWTRRRSKSQQCADEAVRLGSLCLKTETVTQPCLTHIRTRCSSCEANRHLGCGTGIFFTLNLTTSHINLSLSCKKKNP